MALAITAIAHNISDLVVTGVHIKDIHSIPETVQARDCPILYPRPDGFVTNLTVTHDSFGSTVAKKTVTYDLTYQFLEAPIGTSRGLFDLYADFVTHVYAVVDKLIDNDALAGTIDLEVADITEFGPASDPSGNGFHGCNIVLRITEFVN